MTELPELRGGALELWRLRGEKRHELCCEVVRHGNGLALRLYDLDTGWVVISEPYSELDPLVRRSDQMRSKCLAAGWVEPLNVNKAVRF